MTPAIFAEFQKNTKERIRVSAVEFKGHSLVDIRVCWQNDDEWRPTKKGITFSIGLLPEIIEALKAADKQRKEISDGRTEAV